MSGTTTTQTSDGTTTTQQTPVRRTGTVVISIAAYSTFLVALVAAAYLYWVTKDPVVLALLGAAIGAAQTNATTIVGYWVGSSDGSAKKTDMLGAASATPSVVHTETVQSSTATPVATPAP